MFCIATSQTQQTQCCLENTESGRNTAMQRPGVCSQKPLGDQVATLSWQLQRAESLQVLISWKSSLAILTNKVLFYSEIKWKRSFFLKKINVYWKARSPFKMMCTPIRMGCILQKYSQYISIHGSRTVSIETKCSSIEWKDNCCSKFPYWCPSYTSCSLVGSQIYLIIYSNTFWNKLALALRRWQDAFLLKVQTRTHLTQH